MSDRRPTRPPQAHEPVVVERRAPRPMPGSLRWLKGLLARPLGFERRGLQLHLVLVDRRRPPVVERPMTLRELRAELRSRLVAHENEHTAKMMRHLVFVHDELGRKGWPGVAALPPRVLRKARVQAEMLLSEEPSRAISSLIEQLRPLQVAAELRDERKAGAATEMDSRVEVSEASHEEYEEMERSWVGTLPPDLTLPERPAVVPAQPAPAASVVAPAGLATTPSH